MSSPVLLTVSVLGSILLLGGLVMVNKSKLFSQNSVRHSKRNSISNTNYSK